jgi:pyruvate/2-oxoglutarate dehydrogenase complex dihydrolipoamide acyltransferase (E2) component
MSTKWIAGVAALVVVGAGGAAAIVIADDQAAVEHAGAPATTTLHVRVGGSGAATAAGVPAHASGKTKITYPQTGVETVAEGGQSTQVDITKCPKKAKVLNGSFRTEKFGVISAESYPVGKRAWHITLDDANIGGPDGYDVQFGLVCAKSGK